MEKQTTQEISVRTAPTFIDNSDVGWKKLTTTTWLKDVFYLKNWNKKKAYNYTYMNSDRELDIDYEISYVL